LASTRIRAAFVSTNSIAQGEQAGILWNILFKKHLKIHFAHRTFSWHNEARGKAAVHVVIIGFGAFDTANKRVFDYESVTGEPHEIQVKNINPYLVEGADLTVEKRRGTISTAPTITFGSMPNEGGHFLFTDAEKENFLKAEPKAREFIHPLLSAHEFLNGENRWCLWLKNASASQLRDLPLTMARIEAVKKLRLASNRAATKALADYPTLFGEDRQPSSNSSLKNFRKVAFSLPPGFPRAT